MLLKLIELYQKFVSPLLGNNCRYYPSCSCYAQWQLENSPLLFALWSSTWRVLRCNQFFPGGIDYPITSKNFPSKIVYQRGEWREVKYWFVPVEGKPGKYYIIASHRTKVTD
ncbi:MAG: membrane protein insertion efficiency factor YidD [Epsilonproteobacteria bacterium]|nr:membrane protein insertion efficiency factor YidD [Campylobacterota bacterium]